MLRVGSRVNIGDNNWFEIYQFEAIEKRKGKVELLVSKDGKRVFEKRIARANKGTQKVYTFKFNGVYYEFLLKR